MLLVETPEALFHRAVERQRAGDLATAGPLYRAAIAGGLGPDLLPDAHGNLGVLCRATHRLAEAEAAYRTAAELRPGWAHPHYLLGNLYGYERRLHEAEAAYVEGRRLEPGNVQGAFNLGQVYLSQGRFAEGWPLYELRADRAASVMNRLSFPEWTGQPLAGKSIFVWREQGYGDEILMARFAARLKALGAARVTMAPTVALARLFSTLEGVDEILTLTGEVVIPRHDYWALPCSLPGHQGVGLGEAQSPPYLAAPEAARAKWRGFAPQGFNVGFVWSGNPKQQNDFNRSLRSPELFRALADLGANMIDLQEPRGDFADTAAIVEQLDLVLTVDTAMAHLAGALGKRCWVTLARLGTCWRYPPAPGTQSPWYPSVRVYRQAAPGDWDGVFAEVRRDLVGLMRQADR